MGVISREAAVDVKPLDFAAAAETAGETQPLVFEDITAPKKAPPAVEPIPEPVQAQMPPVVEVPEPLAVALYEDAILRGIEDGKAQVMAELQVLQERYANALDQLDSVSRQLVDRNRLTVVTLACRIAQKLIRHHLRINPDDLIRLVHEVLEDLDPAEHQAVIIKCGPDDHAFLVGHRAELTSGVGEAFRIQVKESPDLEYGEFRVETRSGHTDGGVRQRLADVEASMLEEARQGNAS